MLCTPACIRPAGGRRRPMQQLTITFHDLPETRSVAGRDQCASATLYSRSFFWRGQ